MNTQEALAWAVAHGAGAKASKGLTKMLGLLTASTAHAPLVLDFYEAAVDNEQGFKRVKLVHVLVPKRGFDEGTRAALSKRRERALKEIFAAIPGLDVADVERLYEGLRVAGVAGLWLPTASVECDAATGTFSEVSLYSDDFAGELAEGLARGIGVEPAERDARLRAVGCDFKPGGPARLKLYYGRPSAQAIASGGGPLEALSAEQRPEDALLLRRRPRGGAWEQPKKIYLSYVERRRLFECWTVSALRSRCAAGPLKTFLQKICDAGGDAHIVDYLGCEDGRIEIYIGKPLIDASARGKAGEDVW